MREFFRGWRRKIGVITLVMACVFAVGWVRSITICDRFVFSRGSLIHSLEGRIAVELWLGPSLSGFSMIPNWRSFPSDFFHSVLDDPGMSRQVRFCGFAFGESRTGTPVLVIPYFAIVIPLAVLSPYFLLSKQRTGNPPEAMKPPDEAQVTHA